MRQGVAEIAPAASRPGSPDSRRRDRYLPGLDGLRAVSVAAVLVYHAGLSWLPGGYLGVEVFFVISGYLITTLLLAEHRTTGSIDVRSFWLRRARRLLPALFLMLAVVALATATVYREEAAELRSQFVAALTYSTNWFQIAVEESYFDSVGRPSALQHLWSLAIEEQFYLVWPLVLAGLLMAVSGRRYGWGRRCFRSGNWVVPMVIGAAALVSAVTMAALYRPALDPSRVYLGTDTRAQALLIGALLAFASRPSDRPSTTPTRSSRWPLVLDAIGLAGLAGLSIAFLQMAATERFVFQGGMTLVSVLSVMVIAAVSHPATWLGRAGLGNRVLAAAGRRSYGLYLWHWPVFVFTRPHLDVPLGTYPALALRLALTALVAEISYRYVEVPIRNGAMGRWLAALQSPNPRHRAHRRRGIQTVCIGTAVFVGAVGCSLAGATRPVGQAERAVVLGGEVPDQALPTTPLPTTPLPPLPVSTSMATSTTLSAVAAVASDAGVTNTIGLKNRNVTVLADSVLFSGRQAITKNLEAAGWQVEFRGKPALMVKQQVAEFDSSPAPVGSTVVIGLGNNSLWERERYRYKTWAETFDREAEQLLDRLSRLGAERFIWVTLREPVKDVIPPEGMEQYQRYVWYFPYVNERLRVLAARHPNLAIADWAAVSNRSGVTYDAIHLSTEGARVMTETIRSVLGP